MVYKPAFTVSDVGSGMIIRSGGHGETIVILCWVLIASQGTDEATALAPDVRVAAAATKVKYQIIP